MKKPDTEHTRRRRVLKAVGALGIAGIAGCSGDGTDTPTDTAAGGDGTDTPTDTAAGGDGTDTPTDTAADGDGTDTPTDTATGGDGTDTPTETPAQNLPDDPPAVVTLSGGGSVQSGGTTTLTATAENPFLFPIQSVQVSLEAPNDDWIVEATGDTNLGTIDTAASAEVSWEITAPEDASEGITLTGSFSYETTTDSAETELSRSIAVFEPGEVPGGDLEAYYPLDESSLPPSNAVTGTDANVTGSPTPGETGIKNTAFGFDESGTGDRSTTTDALTAGQNLPLNGEAATVGAWFRYTTKEDYARVYQVGGGGPDGLPNTNGGWDTELNQASDDLILVTWQGGNAQGSGTITLSSDTWYFVVSVVDGNDATMYVFDQSGELDASPVTTSGRDQTGDDVLIMMGGDGSDAAGRMDEVRAYSRALSESEVTALYEGSS